MERRLYLRCKIEDNYWAKLTREEVEKVKIRDISIGGISLFTTQDLSLKEVIEVEIVADSKEKIIPKCEVAWSSYLRKVEENNHSYSIYEIGLKFLELTDRQKDFLKECIKNSTAVSLSGS